MKIVSYDLPDSTTYLTSGKVYDVNICEKDIMHIFDDNGELLNINIPMSAHLNGGEWQIVDEVE